MTELFALQLSCVTRAQLFSEDLRNFRLHLPNNLPEWIQKSHTRLLRRPGPFKSGGSLGFCRVLG